MIMVIPIGRTSVVKEDHEVFLNDTRVKHPLISKLCKTVSGCAVESYHSIRKVVEISWYSAGSLYNPTFGAYLDRPNENPDPGQLFTYMGMIDPPSDVKSLEKIYGLSDSNPGRRDQKHQLTGNEIRGVDQKEQKDLKSTGKRDPIVKEQNFFDRKLKSNKYDNVDRDHTTMMNRGINKRSYGIKLGVWKQIFFWTLFLMTFTNAKTAYTSSHSERSRDLVLQIQDNVIKLRFETIESECLWWRRIPGNSRQNQLVAIGNFTTEKFKDKFSVELRPGVCILVFKNTTEEDLQYCYYEPTSSCKHINTSVDVYLNEWSNWSNCSNTCGSGSIKRERTCKEGQCEGYISEDANCNTDKCPEVEASSARSFAIGASVGITVFIIIFLVLLGCFIKSRRKRRTKQEEVWI